MPVLGAPVLAGLNFSFLQLVEEYLIQDKHELGHCAKGAVAGAVAVNLLNK